MTDLQLIEALKKGNESCLKYLYSYLPDVKRFITQNSGDEDDAKDLLQEAIIAFYNNLRDGKYQHTSLKGYILIIVRNKWYDRLEKVKRQRSKHTEIAVDEDTEDNVIPFEIRKPTVSLGEYLQDALNRLGDPCKSIIRATVYLKKKMDWLSRYFVFLTRTLPGSKS